MRSKIKTGVKYEARLGAERDKSQLLIDGSKESIRVEQARRSMQLFNVSNKDFFCPFCLFEGVLSRFTLIYNKGGVAYMAVCPDCKNRMVVRSLVECMTVGEYADWVFGYASSGFWQKINFRVWSGRLYGLGMSEEFWVRYKELKGGRGESLEEHLEGVQREAYEEDKVSVEK